MTTHVSSSYSGAAPASSGARAGIAVLGILAVVAGLFLLFHPYSAARTLALLIGLSLVLGGILEFVAGGAGDRRWGSIVLAVVLVVGGILAAVWPKVTLGGLALLVGIVLVVHGVARIALAFVARDELPSWGWLAVAGVVNVLIGVLALAWPQVTILVLSVILGIQILMFGVILTAAAFLAGRPGRPAPAH
jgi:uncharacterized membrane protein HdeD (DUF308 family)